MSIDGWVMAGGEAVRAHAGGRASDAGHRHPQTNEDVVEALRRLKGAVLDVTGRAVKRGALALLGHSVGGGGRRSGAVCG